jgi:aspartate-semialdehyde dehydrogenase
MDGLAVNALERLTERRLQQSQAFVGGNWVDGICHTLVLDPATGSTIAMIAACDFSMAGIAIDAAESALVGWRDCLARERGKILREWARLIEKNADDLATILVAEQGKPLAEARAEIFYGAGFIEWFASEGERAYGETIPAHKHASKLVVSMQPVGTTVAITPWNFPSAMIARKAGAALAAGCTMIVKPAPETPLSALALAKLAQDASMPAGVFQVITGDPIALTDALVADPRVRALSFTGSTDVGRILLSKASKTVKKVSMELGGHAPFILFEDADLATSVQGCLNAKFATSGQDCLAANRIYVHGSVYSQFCDLYSKVVSTLRVGHGLDPATDIGPMIKISAARTSRTRSKRAHVCWSVATAARPGILLLPRFSQT